MRVNFRCIIDSQAIANGSGSFIIIIIIIIIIIYIFSPFFLYFNIKYLNSSVKIPCPYHVLPEYQNFIARGIVEIENDEELYKMSRDREGRKLSTPW
jgi:hypothetical protein